MSKIASIFLGVAFGFVLTKSEVISYYRIEKMFLFEEPYMFLIIGTAVIVGIISVQILKKIKIKSLTKEVLDFSEKPMDKGTVIGGIIFGLGWGMTAGCSGPIFAQIGSGELIAVVTLIGALLGAFSYNLVKDKIPH